MVIIAPQSLEKLVVVATYTGALVFLCIAICIGGVVLPPAVGYLFDMLHSTVTGIFYIITDWIIPLAIAILGLISRFLASLGRLSIQTYSLLVPAFVKSLFVREPAFRGVILPFGRQKLIIAWMVTQLQSAN